MSICRDRRAQRELPQAHHLRHGRRRGGRRGARLAAHLPARLPPAAQPGGRATAQSRAGVPTPVAVPQRSHPADPAHPSGEPPFGLALGSTAQRADGVGRAKHPPHRQAGRAERPTPSATSRPNPTRCAATSRWWARRGRSSCARRAASRSRSIPARACWRHTVVKSFFRDATVDGTDLRILAEPLGHRARRAVRPAADRSRQPAPPPAPDPGAARHRRHRARRTARAAGRRRRRAAAEAPHPGHRARCPDPGSQRPDRVRREKTRSGAWRSASTRCSTRSSTR